MIATHTSTLWQEPFVDTFKLAGVAQQKHAHWRGKISAQYDRQLGCNVYRLGGNITANNYIQLPGPSASSKFKSQFALTGRFIYIQARAMYDKPFNIHLDFKIAGHNNLKVSISKIYSKWNASPGEVIHVPCVLPHDRWTIIQFDVLDSLYRSNLYSKTAQLQHAYILKSIKLCANLDVKNVFTSNNHYNPNTLPKQMELKRSRTGQYQFFDVYAWLDLAASPIAVTERPGGLLYPKDLLYQSQEAAYDDDDKLRQNLEEDEDENKNQGFENEDDNERFGKRPSKRFGKNDLLLEQGSQYQLEQQQDDEMLHDQEMKDIDQLMQLNTITGYSLQNCNDLKWVPGTKTVFFPAGNTLVAMDVNQRAQQYFFGHNGPICCVAVSGNIVATGQQGKPPLIIVRDWRQGRTILSLTAASMTSLKTIALSHDGNFIAVVGKEKHNREEIVVWPLTKNPQTGQVQARYCARQLSDFNILALKFSPTDSKKLASCGKENIRFWRIKNNHLPGAAVVLNKHARNSVFTCLDFQYGYRCVQDNLKRMYVGSKQGMIYQINYVTQKFETIYQVHSKPIYSIALNQAFCVTGSQDQLLRVWPLDFSQFFMEAKHEGTVSAVDISSDGISIACGTLTGALGILDLSSQRYKTLLRSHVGDIIAISLHNPSMNFVTVATDKTIRLWQQNTFAQSYEFNSNQDIALCVATHPKLNIFCCGFVSGTIRVFDIESTSVVEEYRTFDQAIERLQYTPDSRLLIAVASDGTVSIHQGGCAAGVLSTLDNITNSKAAKRHQPIKLIETQNRQPLPHVSLSTSVGFFATIGGVPGGSSVDLYDCQSLIKTAVINLPNGVYAKCLKIGSMNSGMLALGTSDNRIKLYTCPKGTLIKEFMIPGSLQLQPIINSIDISFNGEYLAIAGEDQLVRVWEINSGYSQSFLGHGAPVIEACFFGSDKLISIGGSGGILSWKMSEGINLQVKSQPLDHKQPLHEEQSKKLEEQNGQRIMSQPGYQMAGAGGSQRLGTNESPRPTQGAKMSLSGGSSALAHQSRFDSQVDIKIDYNSSKQVRPEANDAEEVQNQNAVFQNIERFQGTNPNMYIKVQKKQAINQQEHLVKTEYPGIQKGVRTYIGYNGNVANNLIWNEFGGWTLYTVNNKVIIESLKDRQQTVLAQTNSQISCLACDPSYQLIAAAVGAVESKDTVAPIFVWKLDSEDPFNEPSLISKLNFHHEGVQQIEFSGDSQYLISLSLLSEGGFAIWDLAKEQIVFSKMPESACQFVRARKGQYRSKSSLLEFLTTHKDGSLNVWQMTLHDLLSVSYRPSLQTPSLTQENQDPNAQDEEGSQFVPMQFICAEFIVNQIKDTSAIVLGTDNGKLCVLDENKKSWACEVQLIKDKFPNQIPVTSMQYIPGKHLFVGMINGELLRYPIDLRLTWPEIFGDVNRNVYTVGFNSGPINSISFDINGNQGQVGTGFGSVWYSSLPDQQQFMQQSGIQQLRHKPNAKTVPIKIISSPLYGRITASTFVDHSLFVVGAQDSSFRVFSSSTSDQIICFYFPKTVCNCLVTHSSGKMVIGAFSDGYLRFFNVQSLNFISGKIKISNASLNCVAFYGDRRLLVGDNQGGLHIVFIEQYGNPLVAHSYQICSLHEEVCSLQVSPFVDMNIFMAASAKGKIRLWKLKQTSMQSFVGGGESSKSQKQSAFFVLYDGFDLFSDPHGFVTNTHTNINTPREVTQDDELHQPSEISELYSNQKGRQLTKALFSKTSNNIIFAFTECLQYIFVRDFANHTLLKRITLLSFPQSMSVSKKYLSVGTKEGKVLVYKQDGNWEAPIKGLIEKHGKSTHFDGVGCIQLFGNGKFERMISGSLKEICSWNLGF